MSKISNIFRTIPAQTQKLRGRLTLTAALYTVVGLLLFAGSATATNAYITGETPKEFLIRLTGGVQNTKKDQNLEEELVLGVVAEENKEEETNTDGETELTPTPSQTEETSQPTLAPQSNAAPAVSAPASSETQTGTTEDTTAADPASGESGDQGDGSSEDNTGEQTQDPPDEPQQPDPRPPTPTPEPEPADSPEMASLAEYILKALGFLNEADGFTERYSQILTKLVNNESGLAAGLQHLESDLSNFWVRVAASTAYLVAQPTTDEADEYAHSFREHMKSWRDRLAQIVRVSESYSMLVPLSEDETNKLLDYVDGPKGQEADSHYAAAEEDLNIMVAILEAYCLENTHDSVCK